MTIELALAHSVEKPWGIADPRPWSRPANNEKPVGEIWYERSAGPRAPSLLLKLLFTSEPLSIQVHPDDAQARSMGLENGKTEAWHILSAEPEAKVALGLTRICSPQELRHAAEDGSIADLIDWHPAHAGDTFFVPAGTIHAIGAGLVIAEIQQRSDTTFRLFDHGRGRELHLESAIAVAHARPFHDASMPSRIDAARTVLTSNPHFTFEKIDLLPLSAWNLDATRETWVLVVSGNARAGSLDVAMGGVVFAEGAVVGIRTGPAGLSGLVAYAGPVVPDLLRCLDMEIAQ